jgi:hypothetical protein
MFVRSDRGRGELAVLAANTRRKREETDKLNSQKTTIGPLCHPLMIAGPQVIWTTSRGQVGLVPESDGCKHPWWTARSSIQEFVARLYDLLPISTPNAVPVTADNFRFIRRTIEEAQQLGGEARKRLAEIEGRFFTAVGV